ncbi:hypothetical protein BAU15_05895 [Enterococcus sp. JM4C]|uniref:YcxB family protein n=1 Tax=Candidatus Enterococcus huntleyi TaxID=1857217 RepID=UPI001379D408|nr:YcxB family protein [Enterococcus sp. JM4C]KAF1297082.1 hypothetical protein BAU15_05895 [Enterococcus sp. JM4C]
MNLTYLYCLKKEDYHKAIRKFNRKCSSRGKKIIVRSFIAGISLLSASVFIGVLIVIQLYQLTQEHPKYIAHRLAKEFFSQQYIYLTIIVIYLIIGIYFVYRAVTYPNQKINHQLTDPENNILFSEKQIMIDTIGISSKISAQPDYDQTWRWDELKKIHDADEYFIIQITEDKIIILPKHLLSVDDLELFMSKKLMCTHKK